MKFKKNKRINLFSIFVLISIFCFTLPFINIQPLENEELIISSNNALLSGSRYQSSKVVEGYAIILGISDYPGTENDLNYCDDDANDMYNFVQSQFKIPIQNIIYLTDSMVTKAAIANAINTIASSMDSNDYLFFSYSGHGSCDSENQENDWSIASSHPYYNNRDLYWHYNWPGAVALRVHFTKIDTEYGYDFVFVGDNDHRDYCYDYFTGYKTDVWSEWALTDDIYVNLYTDNIYTDWGFETDKVEAILSISPYELVTYDGLDVGLTESELDSMLDVVPGNIVCLLDSCHSGGVGDGIKQEGRYIMAACKSNELSMEDPSYNNGLFTYQFLTGWNTGLDSNNDGVVSFEEMWSDLYFDTVYRSGSEPFVYTFHPQRQDYIAGETILTPNAKIMDYDYDLEGNINISYFLSGLGYGNLAVFHYDLINNSYQRSYCSMDLTGSPGLHNITVDGPGNGFHVSNIRIILQARYYDFIENVNYGLQIGAESFGASTDSDGDTILDTVEYTQGSNPWSINSDDDSFSDSYEFSNNLIPYFNDNILDLDGDSIPLDWELLFGLSPNEDNTYTDKDGDMLSDYLEFSNYGNPNIIDTDGDLLTDFQEYQLGTLLNDIDTDNDLFIDSAEIFLGTDPTNLGFSPFIYFSGIMLIIGSIFFVRIYGKKYSEEHVFNRSKPSKEAPSKSSLMEIKKKRPTYIRPTYLTPAYQSLLGIESSNNASQSSASAMTNQSIPLKRNYCGKCGTHLLSGSCPKCIDKKSDDQLPSINDSSLVAKVPSVSPIITPVIPLKLNYCGKCGTPLINGSCPHCESNKTTEMNESPHEKEILESEKVEDILSWLEKKLPDEDKKPLKKLENKPLFKFCPECGRYCETDICPVCGYKFNDY